MLLEADPKVSTSARRYLDIPSLDGLRAASITIVFLAHLGLEDRVPGGLGVTVFFVLSGYLITTLLRTEHERSGRISLRGFYVRRIFRILPVFYVVLLLTVVGTWFGLGSGHVSRPIVVAQALHVTNYWAVLHPEQFVGGPGVLWSLALEEHFYLVFPLLFLALGRAGHGARRMGEVFVALCAVVLLWRLLLVHGFDVSAVRSGFSSDTRLDSLLVGAAAAMIANPALESPNQSPRRLLLTAVIGGLAIVGTLAVRDPAFRETFRYSIQSIGAVAILRYVVAQPSTVVGRLLNARPVVWIGQLSYGFYLIHFTIIEEVRRHVGPMPVVAVFSLGLALPLAWMLREGVEVPARRLRDRVLARGVAVAPQATPIPPPPTPSTAFTSNAGPPVARSAAARTAPNADGGATATA